MKRHRKLFAALLILLGAGVLCVGGVFLYASDYSPADSTAAAAMVSTENVSVQETADGLVFLPAEPVSGFIFYPRRTG